jgi:TRAP-type transport system small permease protein
MPLAKSILRRVLNAPYEDVAGTLILMVIFAVMVTAVIVRYVGGSSIFWAEEFCKLALVTLAFLGIPVGFYRRSHMHIDISKWFGGLLARLSTLVYIVASAAFLIILAYSIYDISTQLRTTRSAALRIPMSWLYVVILTATALGVFRLVQLSIAEVRGKK